jgi:hypothetical protein
MGRSEVSVSVVKWIEVFCLYVNVYCTTATECQPNSS